jgi:hypothetical protein
MNPRKSLIVLTALAWVVPLAVHAQQASDPQAGNPQASDPILGTWKLNVAKSKFESGPAPKSQTRTYVQTPAGIDFTDQVVTANGDTHIVDQTYKLEGKPLQLFTVDPNIGSVRESQVSPLEAKADLVTMLHNELQIIGHQTRVESADGKTLTFDLTLTTRTGQSAHDVTVWDRQ